MRLAKTVLFGIAAVIWIPMSVSAATSGPGGLPGVTASEAVAGVAEPQPTRVVSPSTETAGAVVIRRRPTRAVRTSSARAGIRGAVATVGWVTAAGTATPRTMLDAWSQALAPHLGMPWRALRAYGWAELVIAKHDPGCQLTWPTLAAIGWVESRNGTGGPAVGGPVAAIGADDVVRPTILGPILDGRGGRAAVRAVDRNPSDGVAAWARAVGPMQFLPSTWMIWGAGVDKPGPGDPSNIDDAALAAGRLLCSVGDLGTGAGWQSAVLAYNRSDVYAADLAGAARWYAEASLKA